MHVDWLLLGTSVITAFSWPWIHRRRPSHCSLRHTTPASGSVIRPVIQT